MKVSQPKYQVSAAGNFKSKAENPLASPHERPQAAALFDGTKLSDKRAIIDKLPAEEKDCSYQASNEDKASIQKSKEYCDQFTANRKPIDRALKQFAKDLEVIDKKFDVTTGGEQIRYAGKLRKHVDAVLKNPGTVSHDLDTVFGESLRFLEAKTVIHPDNERHTEIAKRIIESLYVNFPGYISNSHTYGKVFRHATDGEGNRTLAEKTYQDLAQRLGDKATRTLDSVQAGKHYKEAAMELIEAEKPKYLVNGKYHSYIPMGGRRDMHAHIKQNYDPTVSYPEDYLWAINMGKQTGVVGSTIMPIPHHIEWESGPADAAAFEKALKNYAYYTDGSVKRTVPASADVSMIEGYNELDRKQQSDLMPAATGIEMMTHKQAMERLESAAEAFAHNLTEASLKSGSKNIAVLFGELTMNKPQVPQEMIGSDPDTFVENSAKLQLALFKAAQKGVLRAVEKLPTKKQREIDVQIRLVIHTDTEKKGERLDVQKISKDNPRLQNIEQPTVDDLVEVCNKINDNLQELKEGTAEQPIHAKIRHVVQLAHFAGVNTKNWEDSSADRTAKVDNLVKTTREYKNLEVLMDTSWLTASARYINAGMGEFLKRSGDEEIEKIGDRFLRADKMANHGFMFFSAGERHFQDRLAAGDNSPEVVDGLALMREACDRSTASYFRELGGIYADLENNKGLKGKIQEYIDADMKTGPSEGNFVGMLLKQYKEESGIQAKTQFVWGADGLTQFAEPSGANKFFMYANQLGPVETLMERLGVDSSGKRVDDHLAVLQSMKMGAPEEQRYWSHDGKKKNISKQGMQQDGRLDGETGPTRTPVDTSAANYVIKGPHAISMEKKSKIQLRDYLPRAKL